MYKAIISKYSDKIDAIRSGMPMSYTGGSLPVKLGVSVAAKCPAQFWLSGIGVTWKETPIYFTEGTLLHGCAEIYHKAEKRGLDKNLAVSQYLDRVKVKNGLKNEIRDYFRAYKAYPSKQNFKNAPKLDITHSEKHFTSKMIDDRSGELLSDKFVLNGRIDLIENVLAVPVKRYGPRILYVEIGEILNAFEKIKQGDQKLAKEGYDFLISKIMYEKPVTNKERVSIAGERRRREQEMLAMEYSIKAVKKHTKHFKNITTDIKTSTSSLNSALHYGQLSFYSYLRRISGDNCPSIVSVINIQKNKEKKISAMRSRAIFNVTEDDTKITRNVIRRALNVVNDGDFSQNEKSCFTIYGRCPYFAICHSKKLQQAGVNLKDAYSKLTIKESV